MFFLHCRDPRLWDPWTLQRPYRPSALTLHQVISRTLTASNSLKQYHNMQLTGRSLPVSGSFFCQHHLRNMCTSYGRALHLQQISTNMKFFCRVCQQFSSRQWQVLCFNIGWHRNRISIPKSSLDSSLLRFVLTCANHPYGGTMTSYQPPKYFFTALLSPPPRGSPHVTTRPSRRTAAKAPLAAWIRWTLTSSACTLSSLIPLKSWSMFQHNKNCPKYIHQA